MMGQAKRNGTLEERIAKAKERDWDKEKKARRFVHLCRFISPRATRESIITCGRNRGFLITEDMGLPPIKFSKESQKLLPYLAMAMSGYSLPKKGFR